MGANGNSSAQAVWAAIAALVLYSGVQQDVWAQGENDYQVIVHPANPVAEVERSFLSRAFLKKSTRWPDGTLIRPVDQHPESSVRRRFNNRVMRRSVPAVRSYWQEAIFSGRMVPPPELSSDREVLRYVLRNPGAVGYVSSELDIGEARSIPVR